MRIRQADIKEDKYAISRVYEESWKYAYQSIIPQSYLNSIKKGQWANGIDHPGRYSLVMEEGNQIIGTASYSQSRLSEMEQYGEIISIYFLPEYMGKGYGKLLMEAAIGELRDMGFYDIFLWVLEENKNARRFYEKFGFYFNGRFLDDTIGGKALRDLQYELNISLFSEYSNRKSRENEDAGYNYL